MSLSIRNFMLVGLMAVVFILVFKVIFTKYQVPGVSEVFQSV